MNLDTSNINFNPQELARYNRHIIIPELGLEGQKKLKAAKVLVVGTGGLGSPLLLYLAAAGVGTIGLVDFDVVDESNLQRQVLFSKDDVGKPKVQAAKDRLEGLNSHVNFVLHNELLTSFNAIEILKDYDIVADGTDNFPTRYLVNDAAVILNKVNVYASIYRFDGQVSVFNYTYPDGTKGPHYRDLYPSPPPPGLVPSCAEGGVLGVLPGIVGSLQANEVIKVITDIGEPLAGRMFTFDALSFSTRTLKIFKDPSTPEVTELIDYEQFCGMPAQEGPISEELAVDEVSVQAVKQAFDSGLDFQLIDVREEHEFEIVNIGGDLIPLGEILYQIDEVSKDKPVYILCKSGVRSREAMDMLRDEGFENVKNVKGGILEYQKEIDNSLLTY